MGKGHLAMKRSAMALLTAAAMLLTGVSCAKKGGSSKVSETEKNTDAQETTAITEEETTEMATEHKSPVETVSAALGSQISVNRVIGRAEGSNTIKFPLADLIEEGDRIESFTFTVYAGDGGNIGEFKGGCGISVDDKCPAATTKGWYQSGDFSAPTEGSYGEITWNVPEELKDYIHEGGEVLFGYWWGNCESLKIDNVVCRFDRTRDVPVDGTASAEVGKSVSYSDEDNRVHIPLDFIPEGMIPEVVTFNVSTTGSFGKFTGAYGISSTAGEFQSGDVSIFTDSDNLQLTWFVPDKAKGCMEKDNELLLGYWWSDQPTLTVDKVEVKYSVGGGDYPAPTKVEVATIEPTTESADGEKNFRSASEIVSKIKVGWNLGNTLESYNTGKSGIDTETGWENPKTTKEMIKSVKAAGFNAVRIPVTWSEHMNDTKIQKEWLDRVQEVVDYAYNEGMFVIINMHHDDYIWFDPQPNSYSSDSMRLESIWKQVSERFADYDDRLIFEGMNEPRTVGSSMEWMGGTKEERSTVNKYAKTFVDTVRASGGNNANRTLIVTTYAASADSVALNDMVVPSGKNIVLSVHYYAPWRFSEGTETTFTPSGESELEGKFTELRQKFIDKGIPVLICEFGCVHGADEATRSRYYSYYISAAKKQGIKCFVWDNSKFSGESSFGIFNRNSVAWDGAILKAIMEGAK